MKQTTPSNRNSIIFYLLSEVKRAGQGIRNLLLSPRLTIIRALGGGKSDTKIQPADQLSDTTLSLKTMPLRDFVNASCYGSDHIQNWNDILSEYYVAKGDNRALRVLYVVAEMKGIEYKAKWLDEVCRALTIGYDSDIAAVLNREYPMFSFAKDTYIEELQHIVSIEKNTKVHYDSLQQQLKELQTDEGESHPDERYKAFTKMRQAVNKHMGHTEITPDSSTYDFAVAYGELERHYEKENSKDGR